MLLFIDKGLNVKYIPNEVEASNLVLYPGVLGIISVLMFVSTKRILKIKITNKQFYIWLGIYFIVIFIFQLIISKAIYFYTDWDVSVIIKDAENIGIYGAVGVDKVYFSRCPNNILLTYTLALFYKIGNIIHPNNPYAILLVCVAFIINISVYLSILCIYKLTQNKKITTIFAIISTILIVLSPWIVIPYSDQVGMIFPILAFTIYIFMKNKYIKNILISFLCMIGYFYKPTILIFYIAYIMVKIFVVITKCFQNEDKHCKKYIITIILMIMGISIALIVNKKVNFLNKTEMDKETEFTMTHYFMMGLGTENEGRWDLKDVNYSKSFPTVKDRQEANLKEAINRIKNMGINGIVKHMIKKNMLNYNNGTFGWGAEGKFYSKLNKTDSEVGKLLRSFYYNRTQMGKYYQNFATIEQIIWLIVLTCIGFNLLKSKYNMKNIEETSIIATTLLGVSIFLLLFECRARYLYIFSPLFIILAALGMNRSIEYMKNKNLI